MAADGCGHWPAAYACCVCRRFTICAQDACIQRYGSSHTHPLADGCNAASIRTGAVVFAAGATEEAAARAALREAVRPTESAHEKRKRLRAEEAARVDAGAFIDLQSGWCRYGRPLANEIEAFRTGLPSSLRRKTVTLTGPHKDWLAPYLVNDRIRVPRSPHGYKSVFLTVGLRMPGQDNYWLGLVMEVGVLAQAGADDFAKENVSIPMGAIGDANRPKLNWPAGKQAPRANVGILLPRAAAVAGEDHGDLVPVSENAFVHWSGEVASATTRARGVETTAAEDVSGHFFRQLSYASVGSGPTWLPHEPRALLVIGKKKNVSRYVADWAGTPGLRLALVADESRTFLKLVGPAYVPEAEDSCTTVSSADLFMNVLRCGSGIEAIHAASANEAYQCCVARALNADEPRTLDGAARATGTLAKMQRPVP